MTENDVKVGSIVESKCTKCRLVLDHVVVSMKDDIIDKVKCNTCNGTHKYRDPAVTAAKKRVTARKTSTSRTRTSASNLKEWETLLTNVDEKDLIPYSMNKKYKKGDKINHPVFGKGCILQEVKPNKIDVLFKDGQKLLIFGISKDSQES